MYCITRSFRAGKAWIWIVVSVAVLGGAGVALWLILAGKVSSDFDLVPRDAQLFATIRVAELIDSKEVKELKATLVQVIGRDFDKSMQQLSEFEDRIGMRLTDIERVTFVMNDAAQLQFWVLVHTKKDIDRDKVLAILEARDEKTYEGKTYHVKQQARGGVAVHFVNSRLAVVGPPHGVEKCLDVAKNGPGSGALKDVLKLASKDKNYIVVGANIGKLLDAAGRAEMERRAENEKGTARKLSQAVLKLQTVTCTVDKNMDTEIVGEFQTRDAAKDAAEAISEGLDFLREQVKRAGKDVPAGARLIEYLDKVKPEQSGSTVTMRLEQGPLVLVGLLVPSVQKVRESAARGAGQDNFHNILDAVHNYASGHGEKLPPSAILDKAGKPLLSWRVALLPDLGEMGLYRQFKLDEPWDSPNNIKLLDRMPRFYDMPSMVAPQRGYTFIQTFTGPGTLYPIPGNSMFNINNIPDGTAFTVFVSVGARAVPWTAPEDIVIDQGPIKPKLAFMGPGVTAGMGDGVVRTLSRSISEQVLRWLIDPTDGNAVNLD